MLVTLVKRACEDKIPASNMALKQRHARLDKMATNNIKMG